MRATRRRLASVRRSGLAAAVGLATTLLAVAGCRPTDGLRARYRVERALWDAQRVERQVLLAMVPTGRTAVTEAIAAYEAVASDPALAHPERYGDDVARDLRRLRAVVRTALATLYLTDARYADAARSWRGALADVTSPRRVVEAHVGLARALALAGDREALAAQCDSILRAAERALWSPSPPNLPPEVFQAPVLLVRLRRESGGRDATRRAVARALGFCDRLADALADTPGAVAASMAGLHVTLAAEQWEAALERIARLRDDPAAAERRAELDLVAGEILLNALDRPREALVRFDAAREEGHGAVADAARLDRTVALRRLGRTGTARAELRALAADPDVDPEVGARALVMRASLLEADGRWDEALVLLRRAMHIHAETEAALDAPLVITLHYAERGDTTLARRSLEQARAFYEKRLARPHIPTDRWLGVTDRLIDAFGAAGSARGAARWLVERAERRDAPDGALALLRAALLEADVLGDTTRALSLYEKVVERHPGTRYAKVAREGIARLAKPPSRSSRRITR